MTFATNREKMISLLSGGTAGLCVDLFLFPLDTMKTRLQSSSRSIKLQSVELRLFSGLPVVLLGSAPSAALFFFAYEFGKDLSTRHGSPIWFSPISAACFGEVVALFVRVPFEVIKQRAQNIPDLSISTILMDTLKNEGVRGMYRGFFGTLFRELPFALIQYPVWEYLKRLFKKYNQARTTSTDLFAWQYALSGSIAGGFAGAITLPLDVAKTRIMLAERTHQLASGNIILAFKTIYKEAGVRGFFSGFVPRVSFLSIGGAIFLGLYDISKCIWSTLL